MSFQAELRAGVAARAWRAREIGRAALAALGSGGPATPATVFAAFERSCYVETDAGIACVGGPAIGRGPLNVLIDDAGPMPAPGAIVSIACGSAAIWVSFSDLKARPSIPGKLLSEFERSWRENNPAQAFLAWLARGALASAPRAANALIGLGPGLTPAGDDFVGGALIALRAAGQGALADRIAAWALGLAERGTGKISRAHLRCAAAGEGHETLHRLLAALGRGDAAPAAALAALERVGHSSGRDAAAGALLALNVSWRPDGDCRVTGA